jgi:hypothetical protein
LQDAPTYYEPTESLLREARNLKIQSEEVKDHSE